MSDLIERYVHEVGRYVPGKERAEIQAELRSQIQDQLDDRYEGAPTTENMAEVLRELGDPRQMAASYGSAQYLIGPELYPVMMMVLRRGWTIVPSIVVLVNVLVGLFLNEPTSIISLLLQTIFNVFQALLIFSGIVVVIFIILQHSGEDLDEITGKGKVFDPYDLPEPDAPGGIDRNEVAFDIAINSFFAVVLLYFLRVGGLTLRFNLSDPGDVLPVPALWLVVMILSLVGQVLIDLLVLRRNGWTIVTALADTVLEAIGAVGIYYVVTGPLFAALFAAVPALADVPFLARMPQFILIFSIAAVVFIDGGKVIKLLFYRPEGERAVKGGK